MRMRSAMQLLFVAAAFIHSTIAFGTINEPLHIGQHSEHERLSRAAFRCKTQDGISDGICFESLSLMQLAGTSGPDGHVGRGFNGAVGAPDTLDPVPEGPEAHCDNADFFDMNSTGVDKPYPQSRQQATQALQSCVDHMRLRFSQGLDAADEIVDEYSRILEGHVDIQAGNCVFSFPNLHLHMFARAKCSALEGMGRSLHGVQDFYAHSNWADVSFPPYSLSNPPGLARTGPPIFLDMRADNNITEYVPFNLSTGCFGGFMTDGIEGQPGHPLEPGSKDCTGRITHHTLNKDNGIINSHTGETTKPGPNTPRSSYIGNFDRAVKGAIKDSQRQWRFFREEIRRMYGAERGNMIICALVRDTPAKDCYNRKIAIMQDVYPTGNSDLRLAVMKMPIVHWLRDELEGRDHLEEHRPDNHGSDVKKDQIRPGLRFQIPLQQVRAAEPLPPPRLAGLAKGAFDFGDALLELASNNTPISTAKGSEAIVALTKGGISPILRQLDTIKEINTNETRVHVGIQSSNVLYGPSREEDQIDRDQEEQLIMAVLRTGGTYSRLHHPAYITSFLEHIVSRGLTHVDNARDTATLLPEGITFGDYVTPKMEPKRYSFDAQALHNAIVSVSPFTRNLALKVSLRHVRKNTVLRTIDVGPGGNATFAAELGLEDVPRGDAWFELEIAHVKGERLAESGVFFVSLESEDVGREDVHDTEDDS